MHFEDIIYRIIMVAMTLVFVLGAAFFAVVLIMALASAGGLR